MIFEHMKIELSDDELEDLLAATDCWCREYCGAAPEEDLAKMDKLHQRLLDILIGGEDTNDNEAD